MDTYYNVGKELSEAGKHYGEGIIKKYSIKLTSELGKGYTETNLKYYRQFYIFSNSHTVCDYLSWSHYRTLLSLNDSNIVNYYINISIKQNLSVRQLRERIKNKEYERLDEDTRNKLISNEKVDIKELVPNPIIIRNKSNIQIATERALHDLILVKIDL